MKTRNLISSVLAFTAGLWLAAASHAAPAFDPQRQPFGSLPPLALTGFNLSGGAGTQHVFQSWFDGYSWSGDVVAYPLNSNGQADVANKLWSAAEVFKSKQGCGTTTDEPTATTNWYDANRIIVTRSSTGLNKPFRWASIGAGHQTAIGSEAILNYVRGDRSNEKENLVVEGGYDPAAPDPSLIQYACGSASGTFRARGSILGDIIHARSVYVAAPPGSYSYEDYQAYKTAKASRAPRLYVGANDGMVHAFDAATGEEVWAYIPSMVIPNLKFLVDDPYYHKYFVDGGMAGGDVNVGNATTPQWKTVLVGGLGAGGKGLFALDVTDETAFNETFAAAKILWEITPGPSSPGFQDLGDTFGDPVIVRLNNKKWAAVVGNGYNNTASGRAWLYVIDIATGALIKALDTGVGSVASPNGLSSPTAVDTNLDGLVDRIYAGDIDGNMWKFDISDPDPSNWQDPSSPLYSTGGLSITGAPDVSLHPLNGYLVFFGTGRLFSETDATDATTVNYAYGIWDGAPAANTAILTQTLTEKAYGALRVRTTAGLPVNWNDDSDLTNNPMHYAWRTSMPAGERVLGTGFVRDSRYHFSSVNPTAVNATPPDGENWLNELDFQTGGVGSKLIFDLNSDSLLSDADRVPDAGGTPIPGPEGITVSIYQGSGLLSQPVLALLSVELSTTIFNDNPYFSPAIQPADPPPPLLEPGVAGGHFDVDIYDAGGKMSHVHEYDDKYNVTGVNFLAPSNSDFLVTNVVSNTDEFKILIANQKNSPAVWFSYGGLPYQEVVQMTEYTTAGLSLATLPSFTLDTIDTLKFNMPVDSFETKDWAGIGDLRVGLMPTSTGCVNGGTTGDLGPPPDYLYRNGALTFQLIKSTTPDTAITQASLIGDALQGYRLKDADRAAYLIGEYTVFWHNKEVPCYHEAGWYKDPSPVPGGGGDVTTPPPGSGDPPWGDLGTVVSTQTTVADDPDESDEKFTIRTTVTTYSTGAKLIVKEWMSGNKVQSVTVTIVPPPAGSPGPTGGATGAGTLQYIDPTDTKTGYRQTREAGKLGRVSWHELLTP